MKGAVLDQVAVLERLRGVLQESYDWGKKDFRKLVRAMDGVDGELEGTLGMLKGRFVMGKDGGRRSLVDFVDEESVTGMRDAMKKSIEELQVKSLFYILYNIN